MTAAQFNSEFASLVKTERKITRQILLKINEAIEHKHYLALAFDTPFLWLVKGHGYSEPAASRRLAAASLLRTVPEVGEKIESGEVNLTTLSQAKTAMRVHTKVTGERFTANDQAEVVNDISNKTAREVQSTMFEKFPETASSIHQERETVLSDTLTRLAFNFTNERMEDLNWALDFYSHSNPNRELAELFAKLLRDARKAEEAKNERSMTKYEKARAAATSEARNAAPSDSRDSAATSVTENSRVKVSDAGARRITLHRAERRCEFVDPATGRVCGSTFMAERDHIQPRALGGPDELPNYRFLCRAHNQFEAERKLGEFYHRGRRYRTAARRS